MYINFSEVQFEIFFQSDIYANCGVKFMHK